MTAGTSSTGPRATPRSGGVSYVHLHTGTVSLLLAPDPDGGLPMVLHWGPPLDPDTDGSDVAAATAPPVPPSGPERPVPWRLLPLPSDGWPLRPGLVGARAQGADWSPRFLVTSVTAEDERTARFLAADEHAGLTLEIGLELSPSGVLQLRHRVTNDADAPYLLGGLWPSLPLPARAAELLDLSGRWCRERSPQRHPLAMGTWSREGRRGRTGHDAPLVLTAGTPGFGFRAGEVWGMHVGWSGDTSLWAERNPTGMAQIGGGELLAPGEVSLGRGETYAAPTVYFAYSDRGLDGLSGSFHRLVRARPGHPRSPRPVVLNTWEAVYFDHRLDRLSELADVAARVGVERFVLDDGWFGSRRDDTSGLGDWTVSDEVWPQGLEPLIEHVRGLGMSFGLWVEPEMVSPDSDLYRAHPEWLLRIAGREPPLWRSQQVLDLGDDGAYAHVLDRLDDLLTQHDIAYLKWDHNRDLVDAGHQGAPGVHRQTTAVYRLLDELRARHPGVEIESCASGGGRVDLGILARTDRVWASDTNDPLERQHIQRWTTLLLPPELIGSHVGAAVSHTTGRRHSLAFRVATAMFGHFGFEVDLTHLSAGELEQVAEAVAFYRRHRGLLHSGDVVRVDHHDSAALVHGVVAPDRRQAVFAYVQLATGVPQVPGCVRLDGLDPGARYLVTAQDLAGGPTTQQAAAPPWMAAGGLTVSGRVLMTVGLQVPILHPEQALVLHLAAV
jgi:alpha-galactosidase